MTTDMPAAPPPSGPVSPYPPSKWPTAIGVISIVFGALGMLSLVGLLFQKAMSKVSMQSFVNEGLATQEEVDAYIAKWANVQLISGLFIGLASTLLLIGGILLVKRKKMSVHLIRVWAVLFIFYAISMPFWMSGMVTEQMALTIPGVEAGDEESLNPDDLQSFVGIFVKAGMAVGVLFWLILPVFYLVWFGRGKIRREVQTWCS